MMTRMMLTLRNTQYITRLILRSSCMLLNTEVALDALPLLIHGFKCQALWLHLKAPVGSDYPHTRLSSLADSSGFITHIVLA